ncbi:MAG: hypothetical protein RLZZ175_2204 [Bacteroidota bacterium]|jgi:uncharacterized protein with HEPN domain
MDNFEIKKLLKDIHICIEHIDNYIGSEKIFSKYESNLLLQDAVERNLITIGEAMNSLLKRKPDIAISNSRKIVDTRNRLTHSYDDIENVQVWSIVIKHLPILKQEVIMLLENL